MFDPLHYTPKDKVREREISSYEQMIPTASVIFGVFVLHTFCGLLVQLKSFMAKRGGVCENWMAEQRDRHRSLKS